MTERTTGFGNDGYRAVLVKRADYPVVRQETRCQLCRQWPDKLAHNAQFGN
jgi:hypothetical protein